MTKRKGCPLFIIGYPRSGTTLLRSLIGAHPQVCLINEPEILRALRVAGVKIRDYIKPAERQGLLQKMRTVHPCAEHLSALPPDVIWRFIADERDLSFREVYEALLPKPRGVAVWGVKSLSNVFYLSELNELYPEAVFLQIVRDPRSTLLSYYRKKFARSAECQPVFEAKAIRFFASSTIKWRRQMSIVKETRRSLGEETILCLKYEDLVARPELELRRICTRLALEFDEAMLDVARRREDPALAPATAYAHRKLVEPIDPSRADAGAELPGWARYIVESYAGSALKDHGYSLSSPSLSAKARLRIIANLSRVHLRSTIRGL